MADTSGKMTLEESGKMHSQIEAVTPSGATPTCRGWVLPMLKSMGSGMFYGGDRLGRGYLSWVIPQPMMVTPKM